MNDRLELALLEVREEARRLARGAALAGAGVTLALLGWIAVLGALVLWDGPLSSELRLLVIGVLHLALAAALVAGLPRTRGSRPSKGEGDESPRRRPEGHSG